MVPVLSRSREFSLFWMVPVPVPEKIGPRKKYRSVFFLTNTMSAAGVCLHLLKKRKLLVEALCEKKKTLPLQQHRHQRPITLHKSLLPPSAECTLICDSGASYNYRLLKHPTL